MYAELHCTISETPETTRWISLVALVGVIPVFLYPGAHLHIMNNHFCSHFCGDEREGGVKWAALPAVVTGLLTRKSLLWFSGQGACWAGKVADAADTRCWNGKFFDVMVSAPRKFVFNLGTS